MLNINGNIYTKHIYMYRLGDMGFGDYETKIKEFLNKGDKPVKKKERKTKKRLINDSLLSYEKKIKNVEMTEQEKDREVDSGVVGDTGMEFGQNEEDVYDDSFLQNDDEMFDNVNDDEKDDNDDDNEDVKYPEMNLLKVTGNFSLRMAHDWINASLPEVPPRVGGGSKSGGSGGIMQEELYYVNSFTQSELSISYSSGFVTIKSDSASSIAILRDVIAGKARDLRVDVDLDYIKMKKGACRSMLTKIDPLLRYQLDIASKVGLIEALQEITLSEEAMGGVNDLNNSDPDKGLKEKFPWLSQELLDILNDANKLQNEYKIKPKALQYISGVLTDLFVDWYRFKGEDVRSRIPDLHNFLITDYHFEGLLNFFSLL
mmetsp:Transcript_21024/g.27358  ORF Transcript_21024/g.27358 Transcript_21024/m.27358 type:complete len:373 (+) Transcript_21024:144-1262(+)